MDSGHSVRPKGVPAPFVLHVVRCSGHACERVCRRLLGALGWLSQLLLAATVVPLRSLPSLGDVHRVHLLRRGDHRRALLHHHHRLLVDHLGRVAGAAYVAAGAAAAAGAQVKIALAAACGARARPDARPADAAAALELALDAAHHGDGWRRLAAAAACVRACGTPTAVSASAPRAAGTVARRRRGGCAGAGWSLRPCARSEHRAAPRREKKRPA